MTTKEELAPLKKVWGEDVKNQAFLMYLEPEKPSPSYIGDALGVPERTIISWRDKYNWVQRRSDSYAIVEQETFNEALANIRARQKLDVERLDLIKEVSVDAIHDEGLEFKDKKQAVDSYIRAQQTIEGMVDKELSRALILEIGTIINEEVKDAETKKRIGARIVALERSWRTRKGAS